MLQLMMNANPAFRDRPSLATRLSVAAQNITVAQLLSRIVAEHGAAGWTVTPSIDRTRGQRMSVVEVFTFDGSHLGLGVPGPPLNP